MQSDFPQDPPALGLDTSLNGGIDQVLALGLCMGMAVTGKIPFHTCTLSHNDLTGAIFCDLLANFYFPRRNLGRDEPSGANLVGIASGPAVDNPWLSGVVNRKAADGSVLYPRFVEKLVDTAEAAILLRNLLHVERLRLVLAGPPTNLLDLLALPDTTTLVSKQVEVLVIAAGRFDGGAPEQWLPAQVAAFRKLLASWPTPVVFVGAEVGEAVRYPAASIEGDYSWTSAHPVVDAYRLGGKMPYDAPTQAMAAVLYAAKPEGYFQISEPGTVALNEDGRTQFQPSPQGKHRHLILDPGQTQRIQSFYRENTSVNPRLRNDAKQAASTPALEHGEHGVGRPFFLLLLAILAGVLLLTLPRPVSGQDAERFDQAVKPTLERCAVCHNARLRTGGLDVTQFDSADAILKSRDVWERIVRRVRAGEMPPPGAPRIPTQELTGLADFVEGYLHRIDSERPPDPGQVSLHRLNRTEYANTVRDVLGLQFRAEAFLPADDSGGGFDTIADLLTMSPALVDRYLNAAELLAKWAVSDELPPEPITDFFDNRDKNFAYVDAAVAELQHRLDYSGEYLVRVGLLGARPDNAAPVKLGFWMDGDLMHTEVVETKGYDPDNTYPQTEREFRVFIPAGDHVFRASFIDDPYLTTKDVDFVYGPKNKFVRSMAFAGPFRTSRQSESRQKILVCDPDGGPECVQRILGSLARRAFRRPVTDVEVRALMRFPELARARGKSATQGIQMAIQAILVSPSFLYRAERGAGATDSAGNQRVSQFDLASRLSYFLWSSMPDDTLLNLAETGQLSQPEVLRKQVDRMLADPKAVAFSQNFAGQWLETRNLNSIKPDSQKFPGWSIALREAMRTETAMFFEHILRENRPITEFLDADYTFLNQILAEHYGIAGVTGEQFRRVPLAGLPVQAQRGGVMSQAGVLTVSSYPNRTSPVLRGKYVLQDILGTPPPPPPPNVPRLDETVVGVQKSMREQLEEHRKNPECAACHNRMDPLGFGLENYDAIGRWRTEDGKFAVDSRGKLPDGTVFQTPAEMRKVLTSQLPQFSRNLTEKMLTYALRRSMEPYDRPTIDQIQRELEANQFRFRTLIYAVVESLPFQYQRSQARSAQ